MLTEIEKIMQIQLGRKGRTDRCLLLLSSICVTHFGTNATNQADHPNKRS